MEIKAKKGGSDYGNGSRDKEYKKEEGEETERERGMRR